jgi:hypothetical protein
MLQAACELITGVVTAQSVQVIETQARIDHILQITMRRREPECQEAAADVYNRLSQLKPCEKEINA